MMSDHWVGSGTIGMRLSGPVEASKFAGMNVQSRPVCQLRQADLYPLSMDDDIANCVLEKHVCLVHVRSSCTKCWGKLTGVCIENHLNCVSSIFDTPIRCNAELKEVQNEVRPKGDVRLVTPRGPSASTIESLAKALQTVGNALCAVDFVGFLFGLLILSFSIVHHL